MNRRAQYRPIATLLASLGLLFLLVLPVSAQEPALSPEPAIKAAEIDRVLVTLKDDKARAAFVAQLEAIRAAQQAVDHEAEQSLLGMASDAIGSVGDGVVEAVAALQDAPRWGDAVVAQIRDFAFRDTWGRVLVELAAILAAGFVAEKLLGMLLAPVRRAVAPGPGCAGLVARLPLVTLRAVFDAVPVAGFAGTGYGVAILAHMSGNARAAALMVIIAWAAVRLVMLAADCVASPRDAALRLAPVDDETAAYLVIWIHRIAGIGLLGIFTAQALLLLGIPHAVFLVVVKAVALVVAIMAMIFVLQNRQPVSAAIHRCGKRVDGRMQALVERGAEIWHVLATLYIAVVYLVWAIPIRGGAEYLLQATLLTAAILVLAQGAAGLMQNAVERGFAISQDVKERFPLLEARANRYLPALQMTVRGIIVATACLALLQAWGVDTFGWVSSEWGRRALASAISIAAVLVVSIIIWELVSASVERYLSPAGDGHAPSARARTLLPLARSALMVVMTVMVTLIVLSELGINIAPLLAGAGVIGIAIGFGSQKLVQDIITGAFILFEDTIAVGDSVKLDSHAGVVEAISVRAIRLRDGAGSVHTIPFSAVQTVINMSRDFGGASLDVSIAYHEDVDRVIGVLRDLGEELRGDPLFGPKLLEPLEVLGLDRFDPSAVVIRATIKTLPNQQGSVSREFNRRLKNKFDELKIEIPFPQTKVWLVN